MEYSKIVKKTINEVLDLHLKENTGTNNNSNSQQMEFIINDQLLLETILMTIRGETIKYSSYKKKMIEEEKQLENDIQNIE